MREIYRVSVVHGAFEIETENDEVIRCSPIAGWMLGKNINAIKEWTKKRNGIVRKLNLVEEVSAK